MLLCSLVSVEGSRPSATRCERFSIPRGVIAFGYTLPRGMDLLEVGWSRLIRSRRNEVVRYPRNEMDVVKRRFRFSYSTYACLSIDRSIDRSFLYYTCSGTIFSFEVGLTKVGVGCAISRIAHNCETRRHNGRLIQSWHVSTPFNVLSEVMTRVGRAWRLGARIYEEEGGGIWKVGEEYPGSAGETSWKSYQVVNGSIGISWGLGRTRCLTLSAKNI